jgi:hypothetical protein
MEKLGIYYRGRETKRQEEIRKRRRHGDGSETPAMKPPPT